MKAMLAVLFCAFAAATATPLFGTEQCANGPSVWCVNIRTAKQCSAVTHCQQTVWNKPVVKSVPCDVCKKLIAVVDNMLKDNSTQTEVLEILNKGCEFLHDPAMVSECKQLVSQYYQLLMNIIEQELDNPGTVCCALGLCQSLQRHLASLKPVQLETNEIPDVDLSKMMPPFMANIPFLLQPLAKTEVQSENGEVCHDCLQLITDVQDSLKSNSSFSKMLIDNFLKQCDQLGGGLAEMCKNYVNQYGDLAVQMLIQMPAQDICCTVGLCSKKELSPVKEIDSAREIIPSVKLQPAIKVEPKTSEANLPICDLCKLVLQNLEKFLDDNRTRAHIKEGLDKVCDVLPSKYCSKCKSFVKDYSDLIITLMEQESTPKMICMALGCCPAREPQIVKLDVGNSESCEVCKLMMMYLSSFLEQNSTRQKIQETLDKICNFLPEGMQGQCSAILNTYGPVILEILLREMNPNTVCAELNMCSAIKRPLLGGEKCMWGPSYWCKDLETAGSCNAIEHCKRHVWN